MIAGSGNFGISSGTRNRAPMTTTNTRVSPVLMNVPSGRQWTLSLDHRARRAASPAAGDMDPTAARLRYGEQEAPAWKAT